MDIQRSGAAILANPGSKMASLRQMNMPWFQTPFFKTLLEEADLAEDDKKLVATYAQDGYLIIDAKIPELDSFCERLIAAGKKTQTQKHSRCFPKSTACCGCCISATRSPFRR